ncbi:30S ribosomal protein S12 methylthiotransferase RimO [Pedosphaera parvula]|uniref:Ribosomal protein uS12 methylthiotransferase RimO n=1 Tax=Pedosphaera parvula (strain Ellin514) TaxID=320771 RepID=B9XHC1_PEDPL|nr:30S ribosomal protein S12 methylthiotransferase RimO [Pedosphaera parvula]EEF60756.1 MiaB-like tRNA modifying enzyme YliG [Pedosphaera parvula Ellin514]
MKSSDTNKRPVRVGLISLGCAKNLVDAEIMLGSLMKGGVEITNDATQADVVIVNTCSFIDSAQEESVDTILQSEEVREANNRGQGLIVSGCLPQRFREELPKLLPEVDVFMGIDQVAQVTEIVHKALDHRAEKLKNAKGKGQNSKTNIVEKIAELDKARAELKHEDEESLRGTEKFGKTKTVVAPAVPLMDVNARPVYIPDFETPRFRLTPKHFAYVKIAEGCNHPCSFCIIPRMRGSHRSRVQADIVREAKQLIADGVKELNLISQDSTYYGLDLRPNHSRNIASPEKFNSAAKSLPADATTLCTLLRELNAIPGDFWIRLLYTHPAHWTDELIQTIAKCKKVARYVDMPLQHIHENMLERMRRETSEQYIVNLIQRIRAGIPGIAIRTTFIVGFPGETETYFKTLLNFIRDTKFERLGVFTYSKEDGTRAGNMEGQLADKIKSKRRELAMAEQLKVAKQVAESFVGKELRVLVEAEASAKELKNAKISSWEHGLIRGEDKQLGQLKGRYLVARSEADAPDIDGRVYVRGNLPIGEFAQVRVIGHTDYDLIAEPI